MLASKSDPGLKKYCLSRIDAGFPSDHAFRDTAHNRHTRLLESQ
jgi:hypothetical protein